MDESACPPGSEYPSQLTVSHLSPSDSLDATISGPFRHGAFPRTRTMKEYETELNDLRRENFHLKLRIYFLEERAGGNAGSEAELEKLQQHFQQEMDKLRDELEGKCTLLQKAWKTIEQLKDQSVKSVEDTRQEKEALEKEIIELQKKSHYVDVIVKENEQMSTIVSRLEYENKNLKLELALQNEKVEDLEKKVPSLQTDIAKRNKAIQALTTNNYKLEKELDKFQKTDITRCSYIDQVMNSLAGFMNELEHCLARRDIKTAVMKQKAFKDSINQLSASSSLQIDEALADTKNCDSLKEQIKALNNEASKREEFVQQLNNELLESRNKLTEMKLQMTDLGEQLTNSVKINAIVLAEKDSIIESLQNQLLERTESLQNAEALKRQVVSFENECKSLRIALQEKTNFVQELLAERSRTAAETEKSFNDLLTTLKKKDRDLEELKQRQSESVTNSASTILGASEDTTAPLSQRNSVFPSISGRFSDLESSIQDINTMPGEMKTRAEGGETSGNSTNVQSSKIVSCLQREVHEKSKEISSLKKQQKELQNELEKLKQANYVNNEKLKVLELELKQSHTDSDIVKNQFLMVCKRLQELHKEFPFTLENETSELFTRELDAKSAIHLINIIKVYLKNNQKPALSCSPKRSSSVKMETKGKAVEQILKDDSILASDSKLKALTVMPKKSASLSRMSKTQVAGSDQSLSVQELQKALSMKEQQINRLHTTVESLNKTLLNKNDEIKSLKDTYIGEKDIEAKNKTFEFSNIQNDSSSRVLAEKEDKVVELQTMIQDLNRVISSKNKEIESLRISVRSSQATPLKRKATDNLSMNDEESDSSGTSKIPSSLDSSLPTRDSKNAPVERSHSSPFIPSTSLKLQPLDTVVDTKGSSQIQESVQLENRVDSLEKDIAAKHLEIEKLSATIQDLKKALLAKDDTIKHIKMNCICSEASTSDKSTEFGAVPLKYVADGLKKTPFGTDNHIPKFSETRKEQNSGDRLKVLQKVLIQREETSKLKRASESEHTMPLPNLDLEAISNSFSAETSEIFNALLDEVLDCEEKFLEKNQIIAKLQKEIAAKEQIEAAIEHSEQVKIGRSELLESGRFALVNMDSSVPVKSFDRSARKVCSFSAQDTTLESLEATLLVKDKELQHLKQTLEEKSIVIKLLQESLDVREMVLQRRLNDILDLDKSSTKPLMDSLEDKVKEIQALSSSLNATHHELEELRNMGDDMLSNASFSEKKLEAVSLKNDLLQKECELSLLQHVLSSSVIESPVQRKLSTATKSAGTDGKDRSNYLYKELAGALVALKELKECNKMQRDAVFKFQSETKTSFVPIYKYLTQIQLCSVNGTENHEELKEENRHPRSLVLDFQKMNKDHATVEELLFSEQDEVLNTLTKGGAEAVSGKIALSSSGEKFPEFEIGRDGISELDVQEMTRVVHELCAALKGSKTASPAGKLSPILEGASFESIYNLCLELEELKKQLTSWCNGQFPQSHKLMSRSISMTKFDKTESLLSSPPSHKNSQPALGGMLSPSHSSLSDWQASKSGTSLKRNAEIVHTDTEVKSLKQDLDKSKTQELGEQSSDTHVWHERSSVAQGNESARVSAMMLCRLEELATFLEQLLESSGSNPTNSITLSPELVAKIKHFVNESREFSLSMSNTLFVGEGVSKDTTRTLFKEPSTIQKGKTDSRRNSQAPPHLNVAPGDEDIAFLEDEIQRLRKQVREQEEQLAAFSSSQENASSSGKAVLHHKYTSPIHVNCYSSESDFSSPLKEPLSNASSGSNQSVPQWTYQDKVVVVEASDSDDILLLLNDKGIPENVYLQSTWEKKFSSRRKESLNIQTISIHASREEKPLSNPLDSDTMVEGDIQNETLEDLEKSSSNFPSKSDGNKANQPDDVKIQTLYEQELHPVFMEHFQCWSSDSDIWSEPDRNVSFQRMGITCLSPKVKRLPRSYTEPQKSGKRVTLPSRRNVQTVDSGSSETSWAVPREKGHMAESVHSRKRSFDLKQLENFYKAIEKATADLQEGLANHKSMATELKAIMNLQASSHNASGQKMPSDMIDAHIQAMKKLQYKLEETVINSERLQEAVIEKLEKIVSSLKGKEEPSVHSPEDMSEINIMMQKLHQLKTEAESKARKEESLKEALTQEQAIRARTEKDLLHCQELIEVLKNQNEQHGKQTESEKYDMQSRFRELSYQHSDLEQRLENKIKECKEIQDWNLRLQREIEEKRKKLSDSELAQKNLAKELASLKFELQQNCMKLENTQSVGNQTSISVADDYLKSDIVRFAEEVRYLQEDKNNLYNELNNLKKDNQTRFQYFEQQVGDLIQKLKLSGSICDQLQSDLNYLQQMNTDLSLKNARLEEEVESLKKLNNDLISGNILKDELLDENIKLKSELSDVRGREESLMENLNKVMLDLNTLKGHADMYMKLEKALKEENKMLKLGSPDLGFELKHKRELEKLAKENAKLTLDLKSADERITRINELNCELAEKSKYLNSELAKLHSNHLETKAQLQKLEEENRKLREKDTNLNSATHGENELKRELEETKQKLHQTIENCSQMEKHMSTLNSLNLELTTRITKLQSVINEKTEKLAEIEKVNVDLQKTLVQLSGSKIKNCERSSERKTSKVGFDAQEENQRLKSQVNELSAKNDTLLQENKHLQLELKVSEKLKSGTDSPSSNIEDKEKDGSHVGTTSSVIPPPLSSSSSSLTWDKHANYNRSLSPDSVASHTSTKEMLTPIGSDFPSSNDDKSPSNRTPVINQNRSQTTSLCGTPSNRQDSARTSSEKEQPGHIRSHYTSPDLGIESDPNQDSSASAAEYVDIGCLTMHDEHWKHRMGSSWSMSSVQSAPDAFMFCEACKKTRELSPFKRLNRTFAGEALKNLTSNESRLQPDLSALQSSGRLCAVGELKDYELLKKEIEESLFLVTGLNERVEIRITTLKTSDGTTKALEYGTLKDIHGACQSIEICLKESSKLVRCFAITPLPILDDYKENMYYENQHLRHTVSKLEEEKTKLEQKLKDAFKEINAGQLRNKGFEKAVSRELIKTRNVLMQAKGNLKAPKK